MAGRFDEQDESRREVDGAEADDQREHRACRLARKVHGGDPAERDADCDQNGAGKHRRRRAGGELRNVQLRVTGDEQRADREEKERNEAHSCGRRSTAPGLAVSQSVPHFGQATRREDSFSAFVGFLEFSGWLKSTLLRASLQALHMRVDELFICMGVKHSFTGNGAAGWRRNLTLIPASGGTTGSGNRITPPFVAWQSGRTGCCS